MKSLLVWLLAFVTLAGANGAIFGGGLGQLGGETTLHVTPWGNDAAASRGKPDKPWLTLSNAVQAARWGDTIILDSGIYTNHLKLHSGIANDAPIEIHLKTNLTILGYGATLYWPTQISGIRIYQSSNIVLAGFTMTQPKTPDLVGGVPPFDVAQSQTNNGVFGMIEIGESAAVKIRDVTLSGGYDHGILGDPPMAGPSVTNNVVVEGCTFTDIGGVPASGYYDGAAVVCCSGWRVVNNQFIDNSRGVELYNRPGYGDARPAAVIANNVFINTWCEAIVNERGAASIVGNQFYRDSGWTNWGTVYPIILKYHYGSSVVGNIIDGSPAMGLGLSGLTNCTVSGNVFRNCFQGISLENRNRNISIVGNSFFDLGKCAIGVMAGQHEDISIVGNTGSQCGSGGDEWDSFLLFQSGSATNVSLFNNSARLMPAAGRTFVYGLFSPTVVNFQAAGNSWMGYSAGFTTNVAGAGSMPVHQVLEWPTNRFSTPPALALGSFAYWNSNGTRLWKCWNTNGTTVCAQTP